MRSLFWKVFLANLLTLLVAMATVSLLLTTTVRNLYMEQASNQLVTFAGRTARELLPYLGDPDKKAEVSARLHLIEVSTGNYICLVQQSGSADQTYGQGPNEDGEKIGPGAARVEAGGTTIVSGSAGPCGEDMLLAQWNFPDRTGQPWSLYVRASLAGVVEDTVWQLRRLVLLAVLAATVISVLVAIAFSRRVAEPLQGMRGLVAEMASGDFSRRLNITEPSEVGELAQSFNALADGLQNTLGELKQEQARLRGILASVAEGIIAIDNQGRVSLINPQAAELLKVDPSGTLGSAIAEMPLPDKVVELFGQCLQSHGLCTTEFMLPESRRHLVLSVAPARGEEQGWGAVAIVRDITAERRLEEMRRQFISDASHEIKTPLTSIGGFAAAIADGTAATPEEQTRSAALILREVKRLTRLVNELLDLSRIESGAVQLRLENIRLDDLIRDAVESFGAQMQEKNVDTRLELPKDLPLVRADYDRIYQVLVNLLSNALRYNPPGKPVEISARAEENCVTVDVEDRGPGISTDQLSRIWERFHRADQSRARREGGTGLGLAIVRSIVEAHGGVVSAKSEVGRGATFSFTLPIA